jgi:hypothetical protein
MHDLTVKRMHGLVEKHLHGQSLVLTAV